MERFGKLNFLVASFEVLSVEDTREVISLHSRHKTLLVVVTVTYV
jgi:hypothetical protein